MSTRTAVLAFVVPLLVRLLSACAEPKPQLSPDAAAPPPGATVVPSGRVQVDEFAKFLPAEGAFGAQFSVRSSPRGAAYSFKTGEAQAWLRASTAGAYEVEAAWTDGAGAKQTQSLSVQVSQPGDGCASSEGALVGVTACCPNRFVRIDRCSGKADVLAQVGDLDVGFPQGVYTFDPVHHRMLVLRLEGGTEFLVALDAATGAEASKVALPEQLVMLDYDSGADAILGVTTCCPNRLVRVDPATGAFTALADVGDQTVGFVQGVYTVDPVGHRLFYLFMDASQQLSIVSRDTATGALLAQWPGRGLITLRWDAASASLVGVGSCCPNDFVRIDPATGDRQTLAVVGDEAVGFAQGIEALDGVRHRFYYLRTDEGASLTLAGVDTQDGQQFVHRKIEGVDQLIMVEFDPP